LPAGSPGWHHQVNTALRRQKICTSGDIDHMYD
jgi:hypothetical protein